MNNTDNNDFLTAVRRKIRKRRQFRTAVLTGAVFIISVAISIQSSQMIQNHRIETLVAQIAVESGDIETIALVKYSITIHFVGMFRVNFNLFLLNNFTVRITQDVYILNKLDFFFVMICC